MRARGPRVAQLGVGWAAATLPSPSEGPVLRRSTLLLVAVLKLVRVMIVCDPRANVYMWDTDLVTGAPARLYTHMGNGPQERASACTSTYVPHVRLCVSLHSLYTHLKCVRLYYRFFMLRTRMLGTLCPTSCSYHKGNCEIDEERRGYQCIKRRGLDMHFTHSERQILDPAK